MRAQRVKGQGNCWEIEDNNNSILVVLSELASKLAPFTRRRPPFLPNGSAASLSTDSRRFNCFKTCCAATCPCVICSAQTLIERYVLRAPRCLPKLLSLFLPCPALSLSLLLCAVRDSGQSFSLPQLTRLPASLLVHRPQRAVQSVKNCHVLKLGNSTNGKECTKLSCTKLSCTIKTR